MLEQLIEKKRRKMVYLANTYGYHADQTIICSQELDKLLNIQYKVSSSTNRQQYHLR